MSPSARRQPRQKRSREKVERILTAARTLLAEGADALNTNRIAELAGVGIGSLYEYFPHKQAIVEQLIDDLSAEETDAIIARFTEVEELPIADAIRLLVTSVLAIYRQNQALYRTLWALATHPRQIGHRPGERQVMEQVLSRLAPIAGELAITDLELTSFTVFHMVESLSEQFATQGVDQFGFDACADEIVKAVSRYLGL